MSWNTFDKVMDTFFRGFQKLEDFFGKGLTFFIFQTLPYLYFFTSLLISIWNLYQVDDFAELSWKSQIVKDFLLNFAVVSGYTYVAYNQLSRITDIDLKILKFSQKFYSEETTKLCFEPLIADWKTEYSSAVSQNLNWKARWISVRYAYAFLSAMLMNSKIGKLLQIIFKS